MKKILLLIALSATLLKVSAQNKTTSNDTTGIRSIELGEVTVKSREPDKLVSKVRPQNAYIVLNATHEGVTDSKLDSTFFVTRFPQPETDSISLYAVEIRLQPYDTSMFDIKLLIYQEGAQDTLRKEIQVAGERIDKKGRLRVTLFDEQITLQPGYFYIGYGFHTKHITESLQYRMYATNKGDGAIITFSGRKAEIVSNPHFPYVFPFRMSYRKY